MQKRKYYIIDHKWLFLFGFIFYLVIPYIAGVTDAFDDLPGMQLYHGFFRKIPSSQMIAYAVICLSWLIAFYAGHFCFSITMPPRIHLVHFRKNTADYGIPATGFALFLVMLLFIWFARSSILGGYASYDVAARGKMSTLLVIFNFFLLYQLVAETKVSFLTVAGTVITCMLLLSMGGRMYVFQTLIILLVYKTSFAKKRWRSYQIFAVGLTGFLVGSISGIWRMGGHYDIKKAFYSFFAEPIFTWISTSTFLASNNIPWINIPMNFLTSFFNMVPNSVISLRSFIVTSQGMGYHYLSPLGADSVWTTFIINFGIAGSFIFLFFTGFLLNMLKHYSMKSRFTTVYYILICSMLPFQFFRDGFYIINKQLFFNFLLFPGMILLILKLVNYFNRLPFQSYFLNKKTA